MCVCMARCECAHEQREPCSASSPSPHSHRCVNVCGNGIRGENEMALYGLGMTSERVCECCLVGGANVCEWNVCVLTAERESGQMRRYGWSVCCAMALRVREERNRLDAALVMRQGEPVIWTLRIGVRALNEYLVYSIFVESFGHAPCCCVTARIGVDFVENFIRWTYFAVNSNRIIFIEPNVFSYKFLEAASLQNSTIIPINY